MDEQRAGLGLTAPELCPADFLPDWTHRMRVTNWQVRQLAVDPEELDQRARRLSEAGVNAVVLFWFALGRDYRHIVFDSSVFPEGEYENVYAHLRAVVEACHRHDIRVIEHHGVAFVHQRVEGHDRPVDIERLRYKHWPMREWLMSHLVTGGPSLGNYRAYMFCPNNPLYREAVLDYLYDTVACGVDGVMPDDAMFSPDEGYCGCRHCREQFEEATGMALPTTQPAFEAFFRNTGDPVYRQWVRFRQQSVGNFHAHLAGGLYQRFGPLAYMTCSSSILSPLAYNRAGLDDEQITRGANVVHFEVCNWNYHFYNWLPDAAEAKIKQAVAAERGLPNLTLFYPKQYAEAAFCWALARAWRHRVWLNWDRYTWQAGLGAPVEHRWPEPDHSLGSQARMLRCFAWESSDEALLSRAPEQADTLADVAILYSRRCANRAGMDTRRYEHEWLGWAESLIEANIQLDVLLDAQLQPPRLARYALVIVPSAMALSDEQWGVLRAYVERGGKVLLTGEAGRYDETGAERPQPPRLMADLLPYLAGPDGAADGAGMAAGRVGGGTVFHLGSLPGTRAVLQRVGARLDRTVGERHPPHLSADWRDPEVTRWMSRWVRAQVGEAMRFTVESAASVHATAYTAGSMAEACFVNTQLAHLPPGQRVASYRPAFLGYDEGSIRGTLHLPSRPRTIRCQALDSPVESVGFDYDPDTGRVRFALPAWAGPMLYCQIVMDPS